MQPKEQSRDNGGDALSQPQPQIDREIDHTVQRVFTQSRKYTEGMFKFKDRMKSNVYWQRRCCVTATDWITSRGTNTSA